MSARKLTVLKVDPGQQPHVKKILDTLESMQSEVGGLIEILPLEDDVLVVCNEEGRINGMLPNRSIGGQVIHGPFFLCGNEGFDFASLTEDAIEKYREKLTASVAFYIVEFEG